MNTLDEIKIYRENKESSLQEAHHAVVKYGSAKKALKATGVTIRKKPKYKKIEKCVKGIDHSFFEGSINELVNNLQDLWQQYPEYTNFYIREDPDNELGYTFYFQVIGVRKETDQEREKRLAKAKKLKAAQKKRKEKEAKEKEARERKEYEKLKKKFERRKK